MIPVLAAYSAAKPLAKAGVWLVAAALLVLGVWWACFLPRQQLAAHPRQRAGRLKQWLNLLRRRYPEAELAYQQVRTLTDQAQISQWLRCSIETIAASACPVRV